MGKTELVPAVIGAGTIFLSFVASVLCVLALQKLPANEEGVVVYTRDLFQWISVGAFKVPFTLQLDALSSVMVACGAFARPLAAEITRDRATATQLERRMSRPRWYTTRP